VQVTRPTFIPLLAPADSDRLDPGAVRDEYCSDLVVVYTSGPQFGRRIVTHDDLEQLQTTPRMLRRAAVDHLEVLSSRAEFHGQPPSLMLSFEGLESSLLLANDFWTQMQGVVPGDLVVGVPSRDVVIVTGSQSTAGLEKARRCVERVFFAGDENPLTRNLLVRRDGVWEPFDRAARQGSGRPGFGAAHQHGQGQPPRQYQEHPSWPGERVRPVSAPASRRNPHSRPTHIPPRPTAASLRPAAGAPAATGSAVAPKPTGIQPGGMPTVMPAGLPPAMAQPTAPTPTPRPGVSRRSVDYSHPPDVAQRSATPYSAVPSSPAPYPAAPSSAAPYPAAPTSAMPYSEVPQPGSSYSSPRSDPPRSDYEGYVPRSDHERRKPAYRDDLTSTGSHARSSHDRPPVDRATYERLNERPRPVYSDHAPVSAAPNQYSQPQPAINEYHTGEYRSHQPETPRPAYPASWGWAPEVSASRPEPSRPEWRTGPRARFSSSR
jgi:hypothetical protein